MNLESIIKGTQMKKFTILLLFLSTSALAQTNNDESCQKQYEATIKLLDSVAAGQIPMPEKSIEKVKSSVKTAKDHASKNEYCKAYQALIEQ